MIKDRTLIIMARYPLLGQVKTRLADSMGEEKALELYRELLSYTAAACASIEAEKIVLQKGRGSLEALGFTNYKTIEQTENDLGKEMSLMMQRLSHDEDSYKVLIGSDCYDFKETDIEQAFEYLESNDFVLGPASDGGYYLIGWKKSFTGVFENIDWSTERVLSQSVEILTKNNLSFALLSERNDLDTELDYAAYLSARAPYR